MTARRLVAEALGTGLLVAAVIGSGIMADRLTGDTALALLANTIATGAALYALVTVLGPVSGAQFNPAVTLVFVLRREIGAALALGYVAAQCLGGFAGTLAAHAMFDLPLRQTGQTIRTGQGQCLAEGIATFALVLAILGAIRAGAAVAPVVACTIVAAYWFTSSTSFANPAVTLARAFSDTFAGIRPADLPAFWLAQLAGAILAAGLACWLFANEKPPA
jgi:glycerol uptake facilitator-like aquaporin